MSTTQTKTTAKEELFTRIGRLSPPSLAQVAKFVDSLETHEPKDVFDCPMSHEPNEETIAALREAEDLHSLTECADLRDMLVKCGLKR